MEIPTSAPKPKTALSVKRVEALHQQRQHLLHLKIVDLLDSYQSR
ncbi:hypothetical protein RV14_GL000948 [Enterococcus ratti]|uniref:Uncharacterized protein n=1 Tax=Enterococcus ratti TaxID=150033 RepID=A0A1L8WRS2_9ENTE|nr:hypothetical protein RV14_GL000948 [Enterococcus ratti]